jgi:metal-responsive CopG/Arc/MetJ family transcriptional regulator
MVNVKTSVSLPEDLLRRLDDVCKRLNMARSEFIARVLEEKFGEASGEAQRFPTVLWKLSLSGYLRLRSPRFRGRMMREKWVVEEFEGDDR